MPDNSPHHYTGCLIDRVFLINGFETKVEGHQITTHYLDRDMLHRQIITALVNQPQPLDRNELLFLRESIGLTEYDLSRLLECGGQDVRYWEMGVKAPGLMRELTIRMLAANVSDTILMSTGITALRLGNQASRQQRDPLFFRYCNDGTWSQCDPNSIAQNQVNIESYA